MLSVSCSSLSYSFPSEKIVIGQPKIESLVHLGSQALSHCVDGIVQTAHSFLTHINDVMRGRASTMPLVKLSVFRELEALFRYQKGRIASFSENASRDMG